MPNKKYHFTPAMDDRIRRLYQDKVGMKSVAYKGYVRDLATEFGRPRWRISRRALEIGVLPDPYLQCLRLSDLKCLLLPFLLEQ